MSVHLDIFYFSFFLNWKLQCAEVLWKICIHCKAYLAVVNYQTLTVCLLNTLFSLLHYKRGNHLCPIFKIFQQNKHEGGF